jgi:hypothetical protein
LFLGAEDQADQDQRESNPPEPELKPLYNQVVEKLAFQPDGDEILQFDEFLNPLDENVDTAELELTTSSTTSMVRISTMIYLILTRNIYLGQDQRFRPTR